MIQAILHPLTRGERRRGGGGGEDPGLPGNAVSHPSNFDVLKARAIAQIKMEKSQRYLNGFLVAAIERCFDMAYLGNSKCLKKFYITAGGPVARNVVFAYVEDELRKRGFVVEKRSSASDHRFHIAFGRAQVEAFAKQGWGAKDEQSSSSSAAAEPTDDPSASQLKKRLQRNVWHVHQAYLCSRGHRSEENINKSYVRDILSKFELAYTEYVHKITYENANPEPLVVNFGMIYDAQRIRSVVTDAKIDLGGVYEYVRTELHQRGLRINACSCGTTSRGGWWVSMGHETHPPKSFCNSCSSRPVESEDDDEESNEEDEEEEESDEVPEPRTPGRRRFLERGIAPPSGPGKQM